MASSPTPTRITEIDWESALPWLKLFRSVSIALSAPKLLVGLVLVFLLYFGGRVMDATWSSVKVYPDEIQQYGQLSPRSFEDWVNRQDQTMMDRLSDTVAVATGGRTIAFGGEMTYATAVATLNDYYKRQYDDLQVRKNYIDAPKYNRELRELQTARLQQIQAVQDLQPRGVFSAALGAELRGFEQMVRAASSLDLGFRDLLSDSGRPAPQTVLGSLRLMLVTIPSWLAARHALFSVIYVIYGIIVWALLGGTIARMTALHACTGKAGGTGEAFNFAWGHWVGFLVAPFLPIAMALGIGLVISLASLVLFNIPWIEMVGGLTFGAAIFIGAGVALLLVGLVASANLIYPATAVEGSDVFDVLSRCYNYVLSRPWRWVFCNTVALVYGAICYLVLAGFIFLSVYLAQWFAHLGALRHTGIGGNRFDAIFPPPSLGELAYRVDPSLLDAPGKATATLVSIWVHAAVGLLASYAVCYYFSANTWIYLLLRQSAEGTSLSEAHPPQQEQPVTAPQQPVDDSAA